VLETIAASLIVAAIVGFTALAYKDPDAFQRVSWLLMALVTAFLIAYIGWFSGVQFASKRLQRFIKPGDLDAANKATDVGFDSDMMLLVVFAILLYLTLLRSLPEILGRNKKS
jgi:hypothetical protein